ncbi:F-box domain-containing protein [Coniochaeta sp. 2T2.1]|nr:F-box domain-containing protein [Coniochaeta sp. 2T2.1]
MADAPATVFDTLPPELVSHIFSFLDSPAPSELQLREQPNPSALSSPSDTHLKSVSRVSKRFRAIVSPLLFRHIIWSFDRWHLVYPGPKPGFKFDAAGNFTDLPLLSFIRENGLGWCVQSITLVVSGQYRLAAPGNAASSGAAPPKPSYAVSREDSSQDEADETSVTSYGTIHPSRATFPRPEDEDLASTKAGWTSRWRQHSARSEDTNWLWKLLFKEMDPKRITIVALPRMLASLLSRMIFLGDAWTFRDQYHILSLDRRTPESLERWKPAPPPSSSRETPVENQTTTPPSPSESWGDPTKPIKTILFTIRPWKSVLLNEGSSTRVYKTYEFFLKRPPSILGSILGCEEAPNDEPLIPPSVRSFSYIAIFPLSSHFNSLVNHLPKIDNLYVQLVPRNSILDDKEEMRNIQVGDLWMERNTCYSLVMRALFGAEMGIGFDDENINPDNGWNTLKVFESGDAADKEAWHMAVEYVRASRTPWTVMADGVLVKGGLGEKLPAASPGDNLDSQGSEEDDDEGFDLFKGQLEVMAWNGSAQLPYSAAGHYLTTADEVFHL